MISTGQKQALEVVRKMGIARTAEIEARGVPRSQLYQLVESGLVEQLARGVYMASGHAPTAEHTLAHVAKRVPAGVFCLLSALQFRNLTTQSPRRGLDCASREGEKASTRLPPSELASRPTPIPSCSSQVRGEPRDAQKVGCVSSL